MCCFMSNERMKLEENAFLDTKRNILQYRTLDEPTVELIC